MMEQTNNFDVIIIGGGHAGIEATYAAARLGARVMLLTMDRNAIGRMSCNPAIGGIGKSHIVFEVSALGGLMPKLCTTTHLQARMLNTSKGPAVQGLRLQIDRHAYSNMSKAVLEQTNGITIVEGCAEKILIKNGSARGVVLGNGTTYYVQTIVVTTGTFLSGCIHIGHEQKVSGRHGEPAAVGLSQSLRTLGFKLERLKTGTPPRLLQSSLDFSIMERQTADDLTYLFEFEPHRALNTRDCFMTRTTKKTHEIIKNNIHASALFSGTITGVGPRYCPSIEDKITRFPDKESHLVFVEPESTTTTDIYPNGLSTSLPLDIQEQYIRSIPGFENAIITKPGYAIEYDFVLPQQLKHTLETKAINNLFLAGQINGTTGYEEAAGQGLVAGVNAARKTKDLSEFILDRNESYIGVMIDDLITLGIDEPYRMFTSRAERRLILRQDNTFSRLADKAYAFGLIDKNLYNKVKKEDVVVARIVERLRTTHSPHELHKFCNDKKRLQTVIGKNIPDRTVQTITALIRYEPYLKREQKEIEKTKKYKTLAIPDTLAYESMSGLSTELRQKLARHKPKTIASASLIPGMTPAALSLLILQSQHNPE